MEPSAFMSALFELMRKRGSPILSPPFVEGRELDLHQFCQAVMINGGSQNVSFLYDVRELKQILTSID